MRPAAFAIPGDIATVTGGFIYERRLLEGLRARGRDVAHVQLGASFPEPSQADMEDAVVQLRGLGPERALILDGLVFGSIDPQGLARVAAPVIAMVHHPLALETGLAPDLKAHLFRTERDNLRLVRHVLVPSAHTAEILGAQYGVASERITIAPPGSDRAPGDRVPSDPPLILSVGLQHPRKGHDVLLRALAQINGQAWRAVIVGAAHDAKFAARLVAMVEELGLRDRVQLAGRIPQAALDALYAEASVFALATRYEGYGMVFDEAVQWGLPIVTCAAGAVPQTVPKGAGVLVPVGEADAFADALSVVLRDDARRLAMAAACTAAALARPGWDDTARIAGEVLDGLR